MFTRSDAQNGPQIYLNRNPCEFVTLLGKRDFADVIKIMNFTQQGDYSGLSEWAQSNCRSLLKAENFQAMGKRDVTEGKVIRDSKHGTDQRAVAG